MRLFEKNENFSQDKLIQTIRDTFYFNDFSIPNEIIQSSLPFNRLNRLQNNEEKNTAFDQPKHNRNPKVSLFKAETIKKIEKLIKTIDQKILDQMIEFFTKSNEKINTKILQIICNETFDSKQLEQILSEYKKIDLRITMNLLHTIWYFRRIGLGNRTVEQLTNFILEVEPAIRWKKRKMQQNKYQPEKKELVFNHFLDVTRTTSGFIDSFMNNWHHLSNQGRKSYTPLLQKDNTVITIISALLHDYTEDNLLSKDQIIKTLIECGFTNEEQQDQIIQNLESLNSNNFLKHKNPDLIKKYKKLIDQTRSPKETETLQKILKSELNNFSKEKDFNAYLRNILKSPTLTVIKLSDILSNFRSPIPLTEAQFTNKEFMKTEKGQKYQRYLAFLNFMCRYDIVKFIPLRFIKEIRANNQHVSSFANHPVWNKLEQKIKRFQSENATD